MSNKREKKKRKKKQQSRQKRIKKKIKVIKRSEYLSKLHSDITIL